VHIVAFANLVNVGDVGMIQCGGGLGFANKPPHAIAVRGDIRRQDLQRDFAIQFSIVSKIHLAHPAFAML
jgi:hypothetical protein